MNNEQFGALVRGIIEFSELNTIPNLDPICQLVFDMIRPKIERDIEKYELTVWKRKYAVYVREAEKSGEHAISFEDWYVQKLSCDNKSNQMTSHDNTRHLTVTVTETVKGTVTKTENVHLPVEEGQSDSVDFYEQNMADMVSFVDSYINELYPRKRGHKHLPVKREQYATFARKLLNCAREVDLEPDEIKEVVETALDEEQHGDMTIFLATMPEQLAYWLVRTGTRAVVELRGTSYDYEQLVANSG